MLSLRTRALILVFTVFFALFLYVIPIFSKWDFNETHQGSDYKIQSSISSDAYLVSLYCGIAVIFPNISDNFFRLILDLKQITNYRFLTNFIVTLLLFCPNILILLYVLPAEDIRALFFITRIRDFLAVWISYWHLSSYRECNLTLKTAFPIIFVFTSAFELRYFVIFCPHNIALMLFVFEICLLVIGLLYYLYLVINYLVILLLSSENGKNITYSQYEFGCCLITNAIYTIITVIYIIITRNKSWTDSTPATLAVNTYSHIIFYLIINTFQNRAMLAEVVIAENVLRIKKTFIRYLSHEIRTPLSSIIMGLQYLKEEMMRHNDSPQRLDTVQDIRMSCEIAIGTLDDMLLYDKIESGVLRLDKQDVRVIPFLKETIRPFGLPAMQAGIDLKILPVGSAGEGGVGVGGEGEQQLENLSIHCDANKMSQVIRNLVSNALKFTPYGGSVTIKVCPMVAAAAPVPPVTKSGPSAPPSSCRTRSGVRIEVVDSGIGIKEDDQKELFKGFIQFSPGQLEGSGLGLYISKGIIAAHQGKLSVYSAGIGTGSTFSIELYCDNDRSIRRFFTYSTTMSSMRRGSSSATAAARGGSLELPIPKVIRSYLDRPKIFDTIPYENNRIEFLPSASSPSSIGIRHSISHSEKFTPTFSFPHNTLQSRHSTEKIKKTMRYIPFGTSMAPARSVRSIDLTTTPNGTTYSCNDPSNFNNSNNNSINLHINNLANNSNSNSSNNALFTATSPISIATNNNSSYNRINLNNNLNNINHNLHQPPPNFINTILTGGNSPLSTLHSTLGISSTIIRTLHRNSSESEIKSDLDDSNIRKRRSSMYMESVISDYGGSGSVCTTNYMSNNSNHIYYNNNNGNNGNASTSHSNFITEANGANSQASTPVRRRSSLLTNEVNGGGVDDEKKHILRWLKRSANSSSGEYHPDYFTIPANTPTTSSLKATATATATAVEEDRERDKCRKKEMTVLIVDDVALTRKMLMRLLRSRTSSCVEAEDGLQAVSEMRTAVENGRPFDLVTMDYQMPNMCGPTATRKIREMGYTGLIVGVTGNALPVDIEEFMSHGANKVFTKPFDIKKLDEFLEETVNLSRTNLTV